VSFTGDRRKMGLFVAARWVRVLAWTVAIIIAALNLWLLYQTDWRGLIVASAG